MGKCVVVFEGIWTPPL